MPRTAAMVGRCNIEQTTAAQLQPLQVQEKYTTLLQQVLYYGCF